LGVYAEIHNLLNQLDVRRPQVLLEVAVVEFAPSDILSLGFEVQTLDNVASPDDHLRGFLASNFGFSALSDQAGQPIRNFGVPAGKLPGVGQGLTTFLVKDKATSIPILIRALQSRAYTEVLSVPRILVSDNEEAQLKVVEETPVTQTTLNSTNTVTTFQTFVPAGTQLTFKPNISEGDNLKLQVSLNQEAFISTSPAPGVPPGKTSRSIKTLVCVPSGRTIILGGLSGRREVDSVDRIPVLADIPVLGFLFENRVRSVRKTSLYIFLTPRIVRDENFKDLDKISQQNQKELEALRKNNNK
jgi:general secretion pathway protein D